MARGRRKKRSNNSRRKGHEAKRKSLNLTKINPIQEYENPDDCWRTVLTPKRDWVNEITDHISSTDTCDDHSLSPLCFKDKVSTFEGQSDTSVICHSEESLSSNTNSEDRTCIDHRDLDEASKTSIESKTANLLYKSTKNLKDCFGPHLLLKFSQYFLVTHSDASQKDHGINRSTVLKVPQPDFASLSDKICVKCWSCIHNSDVRESVHSPCQDLSKQTKVVLQRLNQAQKNMTGSRHDIGSRWKPALKRTNNDILSTDMNGNVTKLAVSDNLGDGNPFEKTVIIPSCYNEQVAVYEEPVLTRSQEVTMAMSMNNMQGNKRKCPPLTIPNERIFFQSEDEQDDTTPEYPLKEGNIFFKVSKNMKESLKAQMFTKTTEQNRNFFSDFPSPFSFHQRPENNIENRKGDMKEMISQRSPRTYTSNTEQIKLPTDCLELTKSSESMSHKLTRVNDTENKSSSYTNVSTASTTSITDFSGENRHEADIKNNEQVHVTGVPSYCTLPSPLWSLKSQVLNPVRDYSVVSNRITDYVTATPRTQNETNQSVSKADSVKGNLNQTMKLPSVKKPLNNLPQLNESTLNLKERDNIVQKTKFSSTNSKNKEEASLVKTLTMDAKCPNENGPTVAKSSKGGIETRSYTSENTYATTLPSKEASANIIVTSLYTGEHVSCETSMIDSTQKSRSLSSPLLQVKPLDEAQYISSKAFNRGIISDLYQDNVKEHAQKEDTRQLAATATDSAVSTQVSRTSKNIKDHESESSASQTSDEAYQLHSSEHVTLTNRVSQKNSVETHQASFGISTELVKSVESSLTHKNKLISLNKQDCANTSLTLPSKRPVNKKTNIVSLDKILTFETGDALMSQKCQTPKKKCRGLELCSEDQVIMSNISAKYAMANGSDLKLTGKQTLDPGKDQSTFGKAVKYVLPTVSCPKVHHSTIPQEVPAIAGHLNPEEIFDFSLLRGTDPTVDKYCFMSMGNQLSPVASSCMSFGSHGKFKIKHNLDYLSETSLPVKTNSPRQQTTNTIAENCEVPIDRNKITRDQPSEKLQPKMKSLSSSLSEHEDHLIDISDINSKSSHLSPQSAKSSQPYTVEKLSAVLDASIMESVERSRCHLMDSEKSKQQIQFCKNNSNQLEQAAMKFSANKVYNGHRPETCNKPSSRMYNHFQQQTFERGHSENISLALPDFGPLRANMPFNTYCSTKMNKNALVPFKICSEPLGSKVAKNGCKQNYNNQIALLPSRDNLCLGDHPIREDFIPWPVSTVSFESFSMLGHAQASQVAQQNRTLPQAVEPKQMIKYPSWVQIPREQTSIKEVVSKQHNSQSLADLNSSATNINKLKHPLIQASSALVNDSLSNSNSLELDNNRSPIVYEPLDLSCHSLEKQSMLCKGSAQPCLSVQQLHGTHANTKTHTSTLHLHETLVNVCRPHSAEMHNPLSVDKSYHGLLHVGTDDSNSGPAAPSTKLKALTRTASANSLPASFASSSLNKHRVLETALTDAIIAEDGHLHNVNTIHSKTAAKHLTPSCKENEHNSLVHTTSIVEHNIQKQVIPVVGITSSSLLQGSLTTMSSVSTACSSQCQTFTVPSSPTLVTNSVTYSLAAQPSVVSSTYDVTEATKVRDCESLQLVTSTVTSSHTVHMSSSLSTPGQRGSTHSHNSTVQSISNPSYCFINSSDLPLSRIAPLPVKDFFTHTPKENTYSSLLMAKITSQNKRHSDFEKDAGAFPVFRSHSGRDEYTFSINNSLKRNLVIDLTEEADDCDVISISSKESLDNDSGIDFPDVVLPDRVFTPESVVMCSNISEVTAAERSKYLSSVDLPGEISSACVGEETYLVQTDERDLDCASLSAGSDYTELAGTAFTNITEAEIMSPSYITEGSRAHDLQSLKENHELNRSDICYNISDEEEINDETALLSELQSQTHSAVTHSFCGMNGSKTFVMPTNILTSDNGIISTHLSKNTLVFKDNLSRNHTKDVVQESIEDVHFKNQKQTHTINCEAVGINISARDNSTQRAAATLLELSANPLYNSYMILPESSDTYQEKVYQVHPTLADSSTVSEGINQEPQYNGDSHSAQRNHVMAGNRSRTKTGRRVGRPPKDLYVDTHSVISEENKSVSSNLDGSCVPPSVQTIRMFPVHRSNCDTIAVQDKLVYASGQPLNMFYGLPSEVHLEGTSQTLPSVAMSHMIHNELNPSLIEQSSKLETVSLPHSVITSAHRGGIVETLLSQSPNRDTISTERNVEKSEHALYIPITKEHFNSLSSNSNISPAITSSPLFNTSLSAATKNTCTETYGKQTSGTYTETTGKQTVSVQIPGGLSNTKFLTGPRYSSPKTRSTTGNVKRKCKRNINLQENVQLMDASLNKVSSESDNLMLNIESPTVHIVTNSTETNAYKRVLPNIEYNNNDSQTDSKSGRKKRRSRSKRARNIKQKSAHSDIDEVLQMLNSSQEITNIVVSTSLEDGLQIVSLLPKAGEDFCQQNSLNGDQIVPVNLAHLRKNWATQDTEDNKKKAYGNASITYVQGLQNRIPIILTPDSSRCHNSTELSVPTECNGLSSESFGEIEKERAVTSLLAEMMHNNRFKENVP